MDIKIIELALKSLKSNTGLEGNWKSKISQNKRTLGTLCIKINDAELCWEVEVKKEVRNYQLREIIKVAKIVDNYMLVAYNIPEKMKELLRSEHVNYLDAAGNISFIQGTHWLWIDGQKIKEEAREKPNRAFTKVGLKVLFVLLNVENSLNFTHRELSKKANVALGNIPLVLAGLMDSGYLMKLNEKQFILNNKEELLHRWIEGYGELLKPSLLIGKCRFLSKELGWRQLELNDDDCWGGEPGVAKINSYLEPEIFTLYTKRGKNEVFKDLRLIPDNKGNVELYQKFWDESIPVYYADCAPLILIYADLILNKDPRNMEMAKDLERLYLDKIIKHT